MNDEYYFSDGASSETPLLDIPTKKFTYLLKNANPKKFDTSISKTLKYDNKKWVENVVPIDMEEYELSERDFGIISSSLNDKKYTHTGFIQYLTIAWASEKGIMLRPDMFHHVISCELSKYIVNNFDLYKSIYTKESKKTDIIAVVPPYDIDGLVDLIDGDLSSKVQNKKFKDLFVKTKFSSQPHEYEFVKRTCFAYSATPYYNHYTSLCGFPVIEIINIKEDWATLLSFIKNMHEIIEKNNDEDPILKYLNGCAKEIDEIVSFIFTNDNDKLKEKLQNIFFIEDEKECGSGHTFPYLIKGWIKSFYMEQYYDITKYPTHLPCLSYKHMDHAMNTKNYCVITGLTESSCVDNILQPL